ncbi:MAG: glycosyltransferase family 4 protein [Gemmatimonadaceae bacterium]
MRVLIITDWNRGHGGAEAYIGWLRKGLRDAGDEVHLLTSGAGSAASGTAEQAAPGTENRIAQTFLQIANPFAARTVKRAVHTFRPDVVYVNMFAHHLSPIIFQATGDLPVVLGVSDYKCICPIGSKLLRDGTICTVQAGWICCTAGCVSVPHWLRDNPRYALLRLGIARSASVVTCSEWVRKELELSGITADVIQLPVPSPGAQFRRVKSPNPSFLYTGRLHRDKGVEHLLRAFTLILPACPTATLRIAGAGEEQERLEAMAASLGISGSIRFLGWLEPPEIERELGTAWTLVAPSLWAEPLGLVALEALVRGVPVIASATGGFAETVEDGVTGRLVPNGDVDALATAMAAVADRSFSAEIPLERVKAVRVRHDMKGHITKLRERFELLREGAVARAALAEAQSEEGPRG